MVDQIAAHGVRSPEVLAAMRSVPREHFVTPDLVHAAYDDEPLPIGEGQTISQPAVVAMMVEALDLSADDRVLEVGTGSGYAAAVLAEVAGEVFSIERVPELADRAREALAHTGYDRVRVRQSDGRRGWPEQAPFDGIVVAAGSADIPAPLLDQLAIGATLVIPVGTETVQHLTRVTRNDAGDFEAEDLGRVRFVPLTGGSA